MISIAQFKEKTQKSGAVQWPESPPLESLWRYPMSGTREDIWAYLSDTSRFNREIGLAKRTEEELDGKVHVTTTMMGIPQKWIEEPWTWIAGQTIASKRTYQKGLAEKVHAVFDIAEEDGARVVYIYFGWTPKNAFWSFFLKATSPMLAKKFAAVFAKIDGHITNANERGKFHALRKNAPVLPERGLKELEKHRANLLAKKLADGPVNSLCDWIKIADDLDIETLRVRALAQKWNINYRDLLTACLHATHDGLLKISWKVVCPHCRGPRFSADTLGDIPQEANCDTCEVEFSTGTEEAIEVVFHVHPSVRTIEPALFCAAEPAKKPHIKVQQQVVPGATFSLRQKFNEGHYRVRIVGQNREVLILADSAIPGGVIDLNKSAPGLNTGLENEFRFSNDSQENVLFVTESLWWETDILRPVDVFSNPEFRNMFSQEHLSADVQLHLGEQALLFTDVVGSTKFYNEVGDAKAFAEIRGHFQEIFKVVKTCQGVVVKTIGDAVMASFPSIQHALDASVDIQKLFPQERATTPIRVRVSVHSGQVMAVQLNNGVDYFGSTVNFTAKIQSAADGHEIAMSKEVYEKFVEHFGIENSEFTTRKHIERREYLNIGEIFVVKVLSKAGTKAA